MASTKRQRKKENQAARRAALEAARRRQRRKRQLLNLGGLLVSIVMLGALLAFLFRDSDGDDEAAAPTTSTDPPVTLATLPPVPPGRSITGDTPCPKPAGEERATEFEKAPPMCIDPARRYRAVFTTSAGVVKVDLDTKRTPMTTNNFVVLARYRYYDGTSLARTDPSIDIIQGGSPSQTISDPGPGYTIKDEGIPHTYAEGDLIMARSEQPDSASAQYFFSAGPKTASLDADGSYVNFGKTIEGVDVLKQVLATHVDCPEESDAACLGGAPQPPVKVESVVIEET